MSRRGLHGLIGSLILVGLLAIGLAFTYAGDPDEGRVIMDMHFCGQAPTC